MSVSGSDAPTSRGAFAPYEWLVALRYLKPRRKEGFISVIAGFSFLGIVLGVATLIIVMAVMNGFRQELFDKMLGLNGHVVVHSLGDDFTNYAEVTKNIAAVPGVRYALPLIEGQVMISTPSTATGALVRGLSEKDLKELKSVSGNIRFGTLNGFDKGDGVAIGTRLASSLNVKVGDQVSLLTPRGASTALGTAPRVKRYPVKAIFELGMSEYDSSIVFMPLKEAQLYFNKPDSVTVLEVVLHSPDEVGELGPKILDAGGPTIYISDWRQRNATFFNALQVERNVMFLILTLIVLVAALNIISGMIMLVKDKGSDIAILRTMGASRAAVMRIFFITGASIGVVGTLAGLILGVLVCVNIESLREFIAWATNTELFSPELYYLSQMPADMDPGETVSVVIMALSLSVLATLYPSWKASRLDPVEALRYG
ncbi:lipoprotein-releasing ABC transporter permease subunit [Methyloligella sp. 2.7D]|uniref:lipoprotein-releasing ABC transporter permease subunit n=1 Tax=unclassified Methyloligella TaxID=2625955 RepID=UPI00157C3F31|nr:lipoprotein-releasing ABC transporter permease subunit [Methyloligella sp. GL2]QKP77531.1 lipoprotein-releasing ABC transporter permease subunit [Methyloligella sp. GL2]